MNYVHDYHCVHGLYYHLVLVVAYRQKVFSDVIRTRAVEIVADLAPRFAVKVLEVDGEEDHLHLLLQVSPHTPFSRFVNSIKTVTSRRLKVEFPEIRQKLWKAKFWSGSYFVASTGGAPLEAVQRYIREQRV